MKKTKWQARIQVVLKKAVLDPQGGAVEKALAAMNYDNVSEVRVGKYLELYINDVDEDKARGQIEEMCRRLLTNPVIEDFTYTLTEVQKTEV